MQCIADFVPRAWQTYAPKSLSAAGGDDRSQTFWQGKCHKNVPKNMQNPSQIWLKIIENCVRRHLRRLKSTNEGPESHFYRSFCTFGPLHDYDFDHFWLQKRVFSRSKKWPKNGSLQNHMFSRLFAISRASGIRCSSILGPKSDLRRSFFRRFSGDGFVHVFLHLFVKKRAFHKF